MNQRIEKGYLRTKTSQFLDDDALGEFVVLISLRIWIR